MHLKKYIRKAFVSFKRHYILYFFSIFLLSCNTNEKYELTRKRAYNNYNYGMFTGEKPIILGTKESNEMIKRTQYNKPFFALVNHFAGQVYPVSCGPASARIILSAIYDRTKTPFPIDEEHSLYKKLNGMDAGKFVISERNIFDVYKGEEDEYYYDVIARQKPHNCKTMNGQFNGGIDADKLAKVIDLHKPAKATYFEVKREQNDIKSVDKFRNVVKQIMSSEGKYMIANYHLGAMYPITSGHFSPIVAYDSLTDRVLIMDVASHIGTWSWVKLEELYRAMNTIVNGNARGYIIIEEVKSPEDKVNKDKR